MWPVAVPYFSVQEVSPQKVNIESVKPKIILEEIQQQVLKPAVFTHEKTYDLNNVVYSDRIVEVPVKVPVFKPVVKKEVHTIIKEVPKIIEKTIERYIDKPEIQFIDKFEEVPHVSYALRYVPQAQPAPNFMMTASNPYQVPAYTPVVETPNAYMYPPPGAAVIPTEGSAAVPTMVQHTVPPPVQGYYSPY